MLIEKVDKVLRFKNRICKKTHTQPGFSLSKYDKRHYMELYFLICIDLSIITDNKTNILLFRMLEVFFF